MHDNKGRGRKAEITDDDITWVINKACQKPKDYGYSAEFWYPMSFRKFINSIAEAEGHPRMATVAETTLRKILSNARIKLFQVSYYCERRYPEFVFTLKHGSWLKVIEGFFSKMTNQILVNFHEN